MLDKIFTTEQQTIFLIVWIASVLFAIYMTNKRGKKRRGETT